MPAVGHYKVVAALPGTLQADSLYLVRVGTGVQMYVTSTGGTPVAHRVNPELYACYRSTTGQNVNAVMTFAWDDNGAIRREDGSISIDAGHQVITIPGTPNVIDFNVNIKAAIDNAQSVQRPAPVMTLTRSDGLILAEAATGYIRDSNDHEESSWNVSTRDTSPIADATYTVTFRRDTGNSGAVTSEPGKCQLDIQVVY